MSPPPPEFEASAARHRPVVGALAVVGVAAALGALLGGAAWLAAVDAGVAALFAALLGAAGGAAALWPRLRRAETAALAAEAGRSAAEACAAAERRSAAEAAARAAEYRALIDAFDDVIVRRDAEGRILYVNDAFCLLFARRRGELLGSTFEPVRLDRVLDAGHPGHFATGGDRCLMTVAGARWFAQSDHPIRDAAGRVVAVQTIARDVTARKAAERSLSEAHAKAESLSRSKSRFLATMSHEMRTPLNGILGMTGLLLDTKLTAEQQTYARAAKASGETLLALIDDLLDFSKIEAGHLDIVRAPFDILHLIEDVVELLGPRAQAKGIEIAGLVDPDLPRAIPGDVARLRQILMNLAANAVKFTEHGGVRVRAMRAGGDLVLSVEDTGIGIAGDALKRIFGEFEQADLATSRRFGGTGLGLAITRRIAEAMGGTVSVESNAGAGSIFAVHLPLLAGLAVPPRETSLAGRRVLVVATSEIEGPTLVQDARAAGAEVTLVLDVPSALDTSARLRPNVLLADRRLGRDQLTALVQGHPAGTPIPRRVVLLTPAHRGEIAELRAAGWDAYLVRPVRHVSLIAQLAGGAAPASDPRMTLDETPRASPTLEPLDILLAEDNAINALLAAALLTKLGHRVHRVADGRAAVEAWRVGPRNDIGSRFDLILMDVQMPGLDGLAAVREIRAEETATQRPRTPIVALTANAFAEDRGAALEAGMDEHVPKPLDRHRLESLLLRIATTRSGTTAAAS
jgi:signal transduction histidine kinase/CheY-like chemotaxis protein